jgi:murein L,D-transpeptidase YcbB/YkuD
MQRFFVYGLGLLIFSWLSASCTGKRNGLPGTFAELKAANFNVDLVKERMQAELQRTDSARLPFADTLLAFYRQRKFSPVWLDQLDAPGFKARVAALYDTLFTEGLLPEWYYRDTIFKSIDLGRTGSGDALYSRLAYAEILLSNALLHMEHDKILGRLPPCSEYEKCELQRKDTLQLDIMRVLHPTEFLNRFSQSSLPDTSYQRFRHYLANWLPDYRTDTNGRGVEIPVRRLKLKDTGAEVEVLTSRLVALGLLPDSVARLAGRQYNFAVAKVISKYQDEKGMTSDGVVGPSTWKSLYASAYDKYKQIAVNMERIRWRVLPKTGPFVLVNIPEFRAWLYYPDSVSSMKVCVGKARPLDYAAKLEKYSSSGKFADKPLDPQTPMIESAIYSVVLNPTWSVPASIVSREMLASIRKNPAYLTRNGYRVYRGNKEISPYAVNWYKVQPGKIPYSIVQDPGEDNSLGLIKFLFPNKYSVYMHDTPLKSKFSLNNRAVSHGCVRLEDPMRFAGFLLQWQSRPTPTYDDVRIWMGYAPLDSVHLERWKKVNNKDSLRHKQTQYIYLPRRVPVFFVYQTAKVDSLGTYVALYDVYGLDAALWKLLEKGQGPKPRPRVPGPPGKPLSARNRFYSLMC